MVEDKLVDGPSYVDYLISLHRIVQQEVVKNNIDETVVKMVINKQF